MQPSPPASSLRCVMWGKVDPFLVIGGGEPKQARLGGWRAWSMAAKASKHEMRKLTHWFRFSVGSVMLRGYTQTSKKNTIVLIWCDGVDLDSVSLDQSSCTTNYLPNGDAFVHLKTKKSPSAAAHRQDWKPLSGMAWSSAIKGWKFDTIEGCPLLSWPNDYFFASKT